LATEDKLSPLIQRALDKISRLDLEGGGLLLEEALTLDPKNTKVMIHLFNIRKTCPEEDRFHEIAQRLLDHLSMDSATFERAGKIYDEYCHLTAQPQLSEKIYLRVSDIFSCTGHPEKAERILVRLIKAKPNLPDIPSALLKLANGYQQEGMKKKHQRCLAVLQARYPYSTEAQIAAKFNRKSVEA
jgi:tetratricopeptide (TPR) repeat protein